MSGKAKTPKLMAAALRAIGHPEHGVVQFTAALLRELDARGLILMPHEPGPQLLDAAAAAMRSTGYIAGTVGVRARVKQAIRYRAMVEAERRRIGVAGRTSA